MHTLAKFIQNNKFEKTIRNSNFGIKYFGNVRIILLKTTYFILIQIQQH